MPVAGPWVTLGAQSHSLQMEGAFSVLCNPRMHLLALPRPGISSRPLGPRRTRPRSEDIAPKRPRDNSDNRLSESTNRESC